ncbi:PRC and DUF2382 domain-containing protein [Pseudonocardia ailaonensis]|uniref:PRC and DUF2382 domain-containing protein n=1 Tax=Pseudonocardia ailaonensis TaxID=367279 RepID=A0ABN2NPI7_9PSEU
MTISDPSELHGMTVIGQDGKRLGKVDGVYLDNETQRPAWAAVKSGMFGSHVSLVPLAAADTADGDLKVPFDENALSSAPHHDPDRELSAQDEVELFRHYGVPYGGEGVTAPDATDRRAAGTDRGRVDTAVGHDTSGPTTDDAMTRSEEHLRVGTETTEVGRARLRKYVVTENVTQTVPVSHEEVRIEREPVTGADLGDAVDGPSISEEEHEVTLHAERPVTEVEAVPVERIRLGKETVTEDEQVSGEVRKEQIETSGVQESDRDR